jgi:hypothetical protein
MIQDRLDNYNDSQCWQYHIRQKNFADDLKSSGLSVEYTNALRVSDFAFVNVRNQERQQDLKFFIERHEWLGSLSQYTTHWFACYHSPKTGINTPIPNPRNGVANYTLFPELDNQRILAGVILFNMPNAFSKTLGENTNDLERLISRGACISWSPKNLASAFLMWCIKWMSKNTQYRLFTAYSDPTAKELGTVYQACNFYYMGQNSGTTERYVNPYTGKIVSDRFFRQKTAYKKFAKELGISWQPEWSHNTGMNWDLMPQGVRDSLVSYSKQKQLSCTKIHTPPKHKYAYVLGKTDYETKQLRKLYESINPVLPYPKQRGS